MLVGTAGSAVTRKQRAMLGPQELFALTQMFPEPVKEDSKFTVMEVPVLAVMVTPDGTAQL